MAPRAKAAQKDFFSAIIKSDNMTRGIVKSKYLQLAKQHEVDAVFPPENPPPEDQDAISALLEADSDDESDQSEEVVGLAAK